MKVLPEWATLSLLYMYVAHIQPEQVGEARKLVCSLMSEEDLVQEGYIGLLRAAKRFENLYAPNMRSFSARNSARPIALAALRDHPALFVTRVQVTPMSDDFQTSLFHSPLVPSSSIPPRT